IGMLAVALALSIAIAWTIETRHERKLRTVASVLAAYREGDFSIRARDVVMDQGLHDVIVELNQLGEVLRSHRLGETEAWSLLRKVMAEVDVVVLAVDDEGLVRLANEAAAELLGLPSRELVGGRAASLGLGELLTGDVPRIIKEPLGKSSGPW